MRAAKVVYIAIAVIILIPWAAHYIKVYINLKKEKKKVSVIRNLLFILLSVLIIAATYALYTFTIGNQAPLVVERYGELFTQRLQGSLDLPGYLTMLEKQNLSNPDSEIISDEELKQAGFETKQYQLSISERTYPMDDGSVVIYMKHDDLEAQTSLYTLLKLDKKDYKWKIILHEVLSQQSFDELNDSSRIKFFEITK